MSRVLTCAAPCLLSLALVSCGSGNAAPPKLLVTTPSPHATAAPIPGSTISCGRASSSGPAKSIMIFSGPCAFTETAAIRCVQKTDDYYAFITHKLRGGATLFATLNVEYYSRPGTYTKLTELYIEVSKGIDIYSWGNRLATATVAADQRSITLPPTDAPAWVGTLATGTEHVSGRLVCARLEH